MPGLGGGGGVNLIQAMPEFWEHLVLAPLPKGKLPKENLGDCPQPF